MRENPKQQIRIWAMLCHLSALLWIPLAWLLFFGIPLYLPFLNILGPLIVWQLRKKQDPWIDFQGKEAVNFQLSLTMYAFIIIAISLLLVLATGGVALTTDLPSNYLETILNSLLAILSITIIVLMVSKFILVSFAAIKAYRGQHYRYPFTIRFLR
ncbi:DUF4870 domain-containing protein [Scytonema sp. NUACC21]